MQISKSPILIIPLLIFPSLINAIACYNPLGEKVGLDFQPCIAVSGISSMCCGINRTSSAPNEIDVCQTNGLCYHPRSNTYLLDSCSDKTWNSPTCLPKTLCPPVRGRFFLQMTQCPNGSWCCGLNNATCCTESRGFALNPNLVTFSTNDTQEVVPTVITTVTSTVTSGPEGTDTLTGVTKKDGTVGKGVFGGVAAGLGVLVLLGIAGGFWVGLKKGKSQGGQVGGAGQQDQKVTHDLMSVEQYRGGVHEIAADGPRLAELSATSPR